MRFLALPLLALALVSPAALAQTTFHNFSLPPQDLPWPAQIANGDVLEDSEWAGNFAVHNFLNSALVIDGAYTGIGNATGIEGRAMWARPQGALPEFMMSFDGYFSEDEEHNLVNQVTEVSFDFAWASTNPNAAITTLQVEIIDRDFNVEPVTLSINIPYVHTLGSGGTGAERHVVIKPNQVDNVYRIRFKNLSVICPAGQTGEFAIDNLEIRQNDEGLDAVYPVDSEGVRQTSYPVSAVKGTGIFGVSNSVHNSGPIPAAFSVFWNTDYPDLYQPALQFGVEIDPGETIPGVVAWEIDTDTAMSGTYTGFFSILNEESGDDPDNEVALNPFKLYDQPLLTANSGATLSPGQQMTIANGPAAGHTGALRASVKITDMVAENPRFSVSNIEEGSRLDAGESFSGTVNFDAAGAPAGTHTAEYRMKLEMTGEEGEPLKNATPVADRVWTLTQTVGAANSATVNVTTGQNLGGAGLAISGTGTGAAIIGGSSSANQQVTIAFEPNPPQPNPDGIGSPVKVDFGTSAGIYVLQLSYGSLPPGQSESLLKIEAYSGGAWVPAISLNGNNGVTVPGAAPYAGSFSSYLSALGGGTLDAADLGAFGVDAAANTVWVVVDYEDTFQIALGGSAVVIPPVITGFSYDANSNTATISYQSVAGQTFVVLASGNPASFLPIGTTATGNGNVMHFIHQPAGSPQKYFYKLANP